MAQAVRRLTLFLPDADALRRCIDEELARGVLFVPAKAPPEPLTPVAVLLRVAGVDGVVELTGSVIHCVRPGDPSERGPGVGLHVHQAEQARAAALLLLEPPRAGREPSRSVLLGPEALERTLTDTSELAARARSLADERRPTGLSEIGDEPEAAPAAPQAGPLGPEGSPLAGRPPSLRTSTALRMGEPATEAAPRAAAESDAAPARSRLSERRSAQDARPEPTSALRRTPEPEAPPARPPFPGAPARAPSLDSLRRPLAPRSPSLGSAPDPGGSPTRSLTQRDSLLQRLANRPGGAPPAEAPEPSAPAPPKDAGGRSNGAAARGRGAAELPRGVAPAAAPEVDAGVEVQREARELLRRTEGGDHYRVLGVARDASAADIRQAFFDLARKFHPDTHFRRMSREDYEPLEQAYQRICAAYGVLSRSLARIQYDVSLGKSGPAQDESESVSRRRLKEQLASRFRSERPEQVGSAQKLFLQARRAEAGGDRLGAVKVLNMVVKLDPFNEEARDMLARLDPDGQRSVTRNPAQREPDPGNAQELAAKAEQLVASGDLGGARALLVRALRLEPSHPAANRLLDALRGR